MSKKILLVDDSTFMRNMLKDIIKKADPTAEVDEATNSNEALEKCTQQTYDLILLDIVMEGASGIEVLKKLGSKERIIVVSAVGQMKMVEKATKLGALDYISKPFNEKIIIKTLQHFLEI